MSLESFVKMARLLIPGLLRARPVLRNIAAARSARRVRATPVSESPVRTIVSLSSNVAIRLPRSRISLPVRGPVRALRGVVLPFLVAIMKYSRNPSYIANLQISMAMKYSHFKWLGPIIAIYRK